MFKKKLNFFIFGIILVVLPFISASQTNSSNYQMDAVVSSGGNTTNSSNYQTDSILGIVMGKTNSSSYQQSLGFFFCIPYNCTKLGYNCGFWDDGCAGTVNCGTCGSGYTCSSGTCTAIPSGEGGAGGPGGGEEIGERLRLTGLEVVPDNFNIVSKVGVILPAKLSISNLRDMELSITVSLTDSLGGIIFFKEKSFILGSKEIKILNFDIISPSEAGIYTGKIILQSGNKFLDIPFILNVESGLSLFDISVDIPEENRIITVGEQLKGQINLVQAGIQEEMDVSMHYIIKDYENNIYLEESETIMVYKQKSYEHDFNTQDLAPGDYVLGAEVIYSGGVATASYPFTVIGIATTDQFIYIILIISLIVIVFIILIILKYYKRQNLKYKKKRKKKVTKKKAKKKITKKKTKKKKRKKKR